MSTATHQPQDDTPMWAILREWLKHATQSAADKPTTLTRKQAAPLMRWIYTLEFTLRRLVFLAATALAITFQLKPARASTHAATARHTTPTRQAANTFRLYPRDRPQRSASAQALSHPHTAAEPTQHATDPRRPSAPIDTFLRPDRHDADTPPEHHDDAPAAPAPKRPPIIYATQSFAERIAYLAQLIATPDKLIARAARALAARREIAARLSEARAPRARGILRTMRRVFNDLLAPLHNACGNALQRYAHANTS